MDNLLPLLYLTVLLTVLLLLVIFLFRQIFQKKQVEDALSELQRKVRSKNATSEDYYLLGTIYLSKKLFDQAIIQFRYALKLWDKNDREGIANLYNTVGFTYSESNQYDLAIYYYSEAIKNLSNYTTALNNLGYAYEKQGNFGEAIKTYKAVISYNEDNEVATNRLQLLKRRTK
jgi:tetratricopeptide (TPR) repeat protein|tara:strand:+ start:1790 stop:2311 length:522 start_codon:yes stop_codon:yes gene_type:complete